MSGILAALAGIKTAIATAVDEYFNRVTLLLNTSSTNGAQNNTFLDSSTNNFTITRNGNTTQGTFTPFSQTGWSNYFDGTAGQYLNTPSNAAFAFGTGDFTVEAWVFLTGTNYCEIFITTNTTPTSTSMRFMVRNDQKLEYSDQTNTATSTGAIPLNTWTNVAVSRSGTSVKLFINGTQDGSTTSSNNLTNQVGYIGRTWDGFIFTGYISNLRVTKGGALYTSTFTPSTTPLTTTVSAGTVSLLTCQSNRFLDNSSNAFTITVNGTPSVQAFSPFLPTAAYDAAVVGGSGYFDGSGDYITATNNAAYNFGTGNFTVECWVYVTAFAENATDVIVSNYQDSTNGWTVGIFGSTNKFYFAIAGDSGQLDATSALQKNTWVHLAAVRSSTTMSFFINGTREATATNSTNNTSTSVLTIGASVGGGGLNFNGYLSGLRVVKGTAVYDPTQSTLTLPTAPPTAITNTSLLLNYTNAGIYDSAAKNVLETVGNAQVSTTQAKWGTTSISLDGTGDWLLLPSSQNVGFGTGDFTIEFWYYTSTTSGFRGLFSTSTTDSETGTFRAYLNNANTGMTLKIGSTDTNFTQTLTANAWVHIAFVRSSGTLAMYYNGTKNGTTASITTDILAKPLIIGANFIAGTEPFTGYIDDFRISKYARYTATFTPPTAAFPLQ